MAVVEGVDELVVEVTVDGLTATAGTRRDELVVVLFFLNPLLVGDRKLKTKATTNPNEATTASTLRLNDHRVRPGSSGGGGGVAASGAGPYRGIRRVGIR